MVLGELCAGVDADVRWSVRPCPCATRTSGHVHVRVSLSGLGAAEFTFKRNAGESEDERPLRTDQLFPLSGWKSKATLWLTSEVRQSRKWKFSGTLTRIRRGQDEDKWTQTAAGRN